MITTDYYDVCEAAVISLLRQTAEFNWTDAEKQVTKSNDVYLDKGFSCNAIAYPGAFPQTFAGTDVVSVQWEILIDLLVRWDSTEEKAWLAFKSFRSKVFNLFNLSYEGKNLNRTPGITGVVLNANDRPRYIPINRDPNADIFSHIGQVTVLTVTHIINKEN